MVSGFDEVLRTHRPGPRVVSGKARLGASMRMELREDVPQGHLQFVLISFRHRDVLRSIIANVSMCPTLGGLMF